MIRKINVNFDEGKKNRFFELAEEISEKYGVNTAYSRPVEYRPHGRQKAPLLESVMTISGELNFNSLEIYSELTREGFSITPLPRGEQK